MAETRVRPPKDKEALIVKLTKADDVSGNGVFQTRAHLLTFAAVLGYSKGNRKAMGDGLEAIRQEVFARHGFDTIINLLALVTTNNPKVLAANDQADDERVKIFEEWANGGLEILRAELTGMDDPLPHLLLMLGHEQRENKSDTGFDLSRMLSR